jgi:hypothetical protein
MSSRYAIHPMEQKFHADMIEQQKRDAYIKDVFDECEELGINEPSRMVKRAFIMGQYYENLKKAVRPEVTRTYEEWLDKTVGLADCSEVKIRHYLGPDQHQIGRFIYETLMKEFAK